MFKAIMNKIYYRLILLSFLILLIAVMHHPVSAELSINGYYKSFFVAYDFPEPKGLSGLFNQPTTGMVSNRIRINARLSIDENISLTMSYNFVPRIQDSTLYYLDTGFSQFNRQSYRADDIRARLYPGYDEPLGSFAIFQNLDRAFLTIRCRLADIYIGRQAIAWGSARSINPTDVIAPYTYDELDSEDRVGVDAVRVRIPIGFMGEIDAGYLFGDDFEYKKSAFYLRGKYYVARTDVALILLGFRENLMTGIDIARAVGGAGFWLEAAYVFPEALKSSNDDADDSYFRGTVGLDYSLTDKMYGFVEYHYNQPGSNEPEDYTEIITGDAYLEGAVYLLGEHYLTPGASYQITPLITFTGQMLWNMSDYSLLLTSAVEYNIAENIYLAGGAYIGLGKRPEVDMGVFPPTVDMRSEFGSYTDTFFTSFRVYF